jgi:two-component system response regulator YesN
MKTKVLFVDDEKLERILISKGYDWEANGFEIVGEACCGEEALEFFERKEPNIVFTDINMPYMDGLELAEKIKERSDKCRIVIITGYREFEYAQRAVKLGVKDFVLKPVNLNDLAETAKKIKEELDHEEGHEQEYNKLKETVSQNHDIVMESFLQRLVEGRVDENEAMVKIKMFSLEKMLDNCVCVSVKPDFGKGYTDETAFALSKSILELIKNNKSKDCISFVHYLGNVIVYLFTNDIAEAYSYAYNLKSQINQQLETSVCIGISRLQKDFAGISVAYDQTKKAIDASVILGRNSCITYDRYEEIKNSEHESIEIDWNDFVFNIEGCFKDKVLININEYTELTKKTGVIESGFIKLMTMNFLSKASSILTKHGISLERLIGEEKLYKGISHIETADEMADFLINMTEYIMKFSDSVRSKKGNKIITQAIEYINAHIFEPKLTLKEVAENVFVNESYLSRIFKQETGEGLIEYITRKRIEESLVLLNTTDLKAYEIAERVGFSEPHYFSICFKKAVGVTIKEYKRSKFQ